MNKHFQHQPKPYNQNNRFHSGKTDPILTLVAMVLCGLGSWQGRVIWRWHTSLLLLVGLGPASLFPPFSLHPAAVGSSLYLPARSSSQAAAIAASLVWFSWRIHDPPGIQTCLLQTTTPILWLPAPVLEKPLSSCSWAVSRFLVLFPH